MPKLSQILHSKQFWATFLVPNLVFAFLFVIKEDFHHISTYLATIVYSLIALIISQTVREIQQKFINSLLNSKLLVKEKTEEDNNWKIKIVNFWLKKTTKYVVFIILLIASFWLQNYILANLLEIYFLPVISL